MNENERLLEEFIREEMDATLTGSGDDQLYAEQVRDYITKRRKLWLHAIEKFTKKRGCACGSKTNISIGASTYCSGCFNAGVRFGLYHAEKIKQIDEELKSVLK